MQFFGAASTRDDLETSAIASAIRAVKISQDAALPFDADDHKRWCDERVREPMILKVGEPETRGAYLKKHTTFLVTEERNGIHVRRRFSDFEWLHSVLKARYIGMLIPSLPEKTLLQSDALIQSRIRGLSLFLQHVMASPYLRGDIAVTNFFTKTDEREWEAAKKDMASLENGGSGHKRWIKRIATQEIPVNAELDLTLFKRQVEQQEKIVIELTACAKRLAEKSAAMSKDVSAMFFLFNGWSVAETSCSEPNSELLLALGKTTTVVSHWTNTARHDPSIYELILHENLRFLCSQGKDMKDLLTQREAAMMQLQSQSGSSSAASVASAASSLAARFRSNSDSTNQSQVEKTQQRVRQISDLITKALLAEELERFRQQTTTTLNVTIDQFACAQGQLTKKSAGIWRDYVKAHVTDKEALLQSTKEVLDTTFTASPGLANPSSDTACFA